ncbi:MAG: prolipoprotein diacylglyceryl transferase [Deltaproteobacteria bacterium]|nr:prolipoprotein diacylglyceryl transferase [Deltaproteobacteria bacterium]
MHPILFRIPLPGWKLPYFGEVHSIPIYSYGVMLGLSLVVGWYLTLYLADRDGLPKETMANCYVVTAIAAIIGSRLLYVLTNLNEFDSAGDFFAFRRGGLVAYGGFLGGYLGSWLYLKRYKIKLMPWADVAVPSLASGLLITRIGCYLFGCDFGRRLDVTAPGWLQKLGTFPHWPQGTLEHGEGSPAFVHHVQKFGLSIDSTTSYAVHPTQLYESLVGLALLGLLLYQRKHQKFRGQVFMLFAFGYGFLRFLIEMFRDDAERGLYGPHLTADVLIPGALAVFALGYTFAFAKSVENVTMRRLTQIISFIPAIAGYLALRPASYVNSEIVQLSTSQWVGVLTAAGVSIGFALFWKVAEAHPEEAMTIELEGFYAIEKEREAKAAAKAEGKDEPKASKARDDDDEDQDEGDEDEEEKKPKAKGRKQEAKADSVDASFDDDKKKVDEEKDDLDKDKDKDKKKDG